MRNMVLLVAGVSLLAGIGMAVASGLYVVSIAATLLSLIGLEVLGWFSRNHKNAGESR